MKQKDLKTIFYILLILLVLYIPYKKLQKKENSIPNTPISNQYFDYVMPSNPSKPIEEKPIEKIKDPKFSNLAVVRVRINEKSFYADVINHAQQPVLDESRSTNAHESTHRINAEVRNNYNKHNAFYVGNDKVVILKEPAITKNQSIEFIPNNLRFMRFSLYILGQQEWNLQPLYILDEWTAYINGATVSVEDFETGRYRGQWQDAVAGSLEFTIYSIAIAMAVEKYDPVYWNSENGEELRRFIIWNGKRAQDVYLKGYKKPMFIWDKQEKLYNDFKNSPDAANMREFVKKYLDNIWL